MTRAQEREILIACVLGDGCIVRHKKLGTHWLKISHAPAQKDYLEWKVALIESLPRMKGRRFSIKYKENHHANGRVYPLYEANLYGVRYFRILRDWMYPADKKSGTRVLKYLHTPLALAIMLMDDGTVHRQKCHHRDGVEYYRPATLRWGLCRPEAESDATLFWLASTFGVQGYATRHSRKDAPVTYYVLGFNRTNTEKLWNLISPAVLGIASMREKFKHLVTA